MNRRQLIRAAAVLAPAVISLTEPALAAGGGASLMRMQADSVHDLEEVTIAELQSAMETGNLSARQLLNRYLARIESLDPSVNSILELNPDAAQLADALDAERAASGARGPLHGIPVLLKDNIDTADGTQTTAGSMALLEVPVSQDATVAARLRAAGAVILGKAGLSEWANFRSTRSSSGWSARGRQVNNPYVLDRNPCGSSSGSAAAVSANLATVAIGTETDGSIVCPSSITGVVGIKPTVGLTSRAGVIPISHSQDTVGPHARTVADAALVLGVLAGLDPRDSATPASSGHVFADYSQFLDADGLRGAHLGVVRQYRSGISEHADAIFEAAVEQLRAAGAVLEDVEIPGEAEIRDPARITGANGDSSELIVLEYEFKANIEQYLQTRSGASVHNLADLIQFNLDHADQEMPYFGQERFIQCQARGPLTDDLYLKALDLNRAFAEAFTKFMGQRGFDALVALTRGPAWTTDLINGDHGLINSSQPAAVAGFPIVTVPAGYVLGELPIGISFFGVAWSEPTLIRLAYGFEQSNPVRRAPRFLSTLPRL